MKHSQNASIIFVTQKGLGLLHQKRDTLIEELRLAQLHKGQAAGEDSNAWHDNAEYDFFAQKETRMASQLAETMRHIDNASVVKPPTQSDKVAIGHTITLRSEKGEEKVYEVVGFSETDLSTSPQKLSYDSPLLRDFFEKPLGSKSAIPYRGTFMEFTLTEIR